MNTPPTLIIVTGFACALGRISQILRFKANGTNSAYLFSHESKLRDKYLGNLMQVVFKCAILPEDTWIKHQALEYLEHPIIKREEFFKACSRYFLIQKTTLSEDTFDHSILTPEGKTFGEGVYQDHRAFFERILIAVYHLHSLGDLRVSCGIIFTSED